MKNQTNLNAALADPYMQPEKLERVGIAFLGTYQSPLHFHIGIPNYFSMPPSYTKESQGEPSWASFSFSLVFSG